MALILAQTVMVLMLALWLSVAVYDNLKNPVINGQFVAEVLAMRRLQTEFPDLYALHADRAVESEAYHRLIFRLIVMGEVLTALALWIGFTSLNLSLAGALDVDMARSVAILATLAFTSIWCCFLIFGNYWCYWMCHDAAQNTHFKMTLWGLGVLVFLAI